MLAEVKTSRSSSTTGGSSASEHALGQLDRPALAAGALAQDRELVAAHARERVLRAEHAGETQRHRDEQLVAEVVSERLVDHPEAIQVQVEHGDGAAAARRAGDRVLQPVVEQRPVGDARQGVVHGLVAGTLLAAVAPQRCGQDLRGRPEERELLGSEGFVAGIERGDQHDRAAVVRTHHGDRGARAAGEPPGPGHDTERVVPAMTAACA